MRRPEHLNTGDKVVIVAPAGKINQEKVKLAINTLESWGLIVEVADHVFDSYFHFSGTSGY